MVRPDRLPAPYVVFFIPAFNEEASIRATLEGLGRELAHEWCRDLRHDIVVVDDGSRDHTAAEATAWGATVIRHPVNRGLGAAVRTGLTAARDRGADIVVKLDADGQFVTDDLRAMIRPLLEDRADCVFGSRFLGSIGYRMPWPRRFGNAAFAWLTSLLSGLAVSDSSTGLIACNRRYLTCFTILSDFNETQQLIIDAAGQGMRVIEVPVSSVDRVAGRSFVRWTYPLKVVPAMLRAFVHVKVRRRGPRAGGAGPNR